MALLVGRDLGIRPREKTAISEAVNQKVRKKQGLLHVPNGNWNIYVRLTGNIYLHLAEMYGFLNV